MNSFSNATDDSVLFIGDCSYWSTLANSFLLANFARVDTVFWESGMSHQKIVTQWRGDWILSFKSDLLLSANVLSCAAKGAINFHPAPPHYRGIGGYFYSVFNKDKKYGVTCHHIDKRVDHGDIISVSYFDLLPSDNASIVREKAAAHCLVQFCEMISLIAQDTLLPSSGEKWGHKLYLKADLKEFIKEHSLIAV